MIRLSPLFGLGFLLSCGGGSSRSTSSPQPATPDYADWSSFDAAVDSCDGAQCRTQFSAVENCGFTVFKYLVILDGSMKVQTKSGVFVRQGQAHDLIFDETPETFASSAANASYHIYVCLGQDGTL